MTPKKIDKRKLAAKLEELTDNIANRGVYIAVPQDSWYAVMDYVTRTVILNEIPGRDVADKIAQRFNAVKKLPSQKINKARDLISGLHKYGNDIEFYRNILRNSTDRDRIDTALVRLNMAKQHLEKHVRDVNKI